MKANRISWLLLVITLLASGLVSAKDNTTVEAGTGLAFGAFDISDSDLAVTHAVLMRIKPTKMYMGSSGEKETVTYELGQFYSANLSPGLYSLVGFFSGNQFFALEKGLRKNTFQVEAGRVVYAGSYKLSLEKGGLFRRDKGSFARVDAPDAERELLRWLTKELAGSGWAPAAKARLTEAEKAAK